VLGFAADAVLLLLLDSRMLTHLIAFVHFSYTVFFGCCIAGAFLTLLLPEVKGRDADALLAQEIEVERVKSRQH
jgi:hypothetical protein